MTDCPTVYQLPGDAKWYMSFIGNDGKGYQSFVVESDNLVVWTSPRLAMGVHPAREDSVGVSRRAQGRDAQLKHIDVSCPGDYAPEPGQ